MNRRMLYGILVLATACSSKGGTGASGSGGTSATGTGGATASGGATGMTTGTGGTTIGSGGHGASGGGAVATGGAAAGGRGGSGTIGSGGRSGASGGAGGTVSNASVLERNNHPSRDGHFLQPQITTAAATAASKTQTPGFTAAFTGSMFASPLYLQNGPGGKGLFFAVATNNNVYAFDETDGHIVWMTSIGSAATANQSGSPACGNIHPLGILSTPVIDATARKIYVAGAVGTSSIMKHEVHALNVDTGADATSGGWPVDVTALSSGSVTFASATSYENQRSALSLVNGTIYVPYGGHVGDCGPYHGWVVAINGADATQVGAWATKGQGEAIWAAGGMASDGTAVFPMTGNRTGGSGTHQDSEEVVRITGLAKVDTSANANVFYPTSWSSMDGSDADLGSNSSLYIEVPGATPSTYIVAISKDGHMYLLDSKNLGGMGGQVLDFSVASAGMSIHTAPAAYMSSAGVHVLFSTDAGAKCPSGGPSGSVVMSVLIPAGSPPAPKVEWCASLGGTITAPIATTSDGQNEAIVWFMRAGKLTGVDGASGAVIYTSTDTCSGVQRWTSPIAVNGRIVAGGDNHLCSWTVH